MFRRFDKIRREFGHGEMLRCVLLLVGTVGMAVLGAAALSSPAAAAVAGVGLGLGFLLRRQIPRGIEYYNRVIPIGLFMYGLVLFVGDRLGLDRNTKLVVITATTVLGFNLKFWSLSDPGVYNSEPTAG